MLQKYSWFKGGMFFTIIIATCKIMGVAHGSFLHSMAGFPYEIIDAKGVTADLAK
jgi:hypothetical protein